jgi:hypothetical protein
VGDVVEPQATLSRTAGTFDAGRITVLYTYRDTDGRILTIECTNTSPTFNLTITLRNPTTRVVYWTATQSKNAGQKTWQEPDFPTSTLGRITNPKPPGGLIWAANNIIELALT